MLQSSTTQRSLHSLHSLDKTLPGLENTFCTQLQAASAALHQPAAEDAREARGGKAGGDVGSEGEGGGVEERERRERRTEGPRGSGISSTSGAGRPWLHRLGQESGDTWVFHSEVVFEELKTWPDVRQDL